MNRDLAAGDEAIDAAGGRGEQMSQAGIIAGIGQRDGAVPGGKAVARLGEKPLGRGIELQDPAMLVDDDGAETAGIGRLEVVAQLQGAEAPPDPGDAGQGGGNGAKRGDVRVFEGRALGIDVGVPVDAILIEGDDQGDGAQTLRPRPFVEEDRPLEIPPGHQQVVGQHRSCRGSRHCRKERVGHLGRHRQLPEGRRAIAVELIEGLVVVVPADADHRACRADLSLQRRHGGGPGRVVMSRAVEVIDEIVEARCHLPRHALGCAQIGG